MTYQYLFVDLNNGYYRTYTPFTTDKSLTQEDATKFILMANSAAKRIGGTIKDLYSVATGEGYDMKIYHCTYKGRNSDIENLDPLPRDFDSWTLIEGISGNY